jgi:cation diffusion facilitator family transporter
VAIMLLSTAILIGIEAGQEIRTPHRTPAPWTLIVLVGVMAVKWTLSRRVHDVGASTGSSAVRADAIHHLSDAITSAAAFIGISIAIIGERLDRDSRWASADDWAAIGAALVIVYNGFAMLRVAVDDLMDRGPSDDLVRRIAAAAHSVPEVLFTEQITARKSGTAYWITLHAQAAPELSLHEAHIVSGKVKHAIRAALPHVVSVLVHMEPFEPKPPEP